MINTVISHSSSEILCPIALIRDYWTYNANKSNNNFLLFNITKNRNSQIYMKFWNFIQKLINNSWRKSHKGNHGREGVFICDERHADFLQNFCLDFLGLYNTYIENSFVNNLTRWVKNGSFLKPFKILAIRAFISDKKLLLVF